MCAGGLSRGKDGSFSTLPSDVFDPTDQLDHDEPAEAGYVFSAIDGSGTDGGIATGSSDQTMVLTTPLFFGSAAPLPGQQRAVIAGGYTDLSFKMSSLVELYDERAITKSEGAGPAPIFAPSAGGLPITLRQVRGGLVAVAPGDGTVLLTGGESGNQDPSRTPSEQRRDFADPITPPGVADEHAHPHARRCLRPRRAPRAHVARPKRRSARRRRRSRRKNEEEAGTSSQEGRAEEGSSEERGASEEGGSEERGAQEGRASREERGAAREERGAAREEGAAAQAREEERELRGRRHLGARARRREVEAGSEKEAPAPKVEKKPVVDDDDETDASSSRSRLIERVEDPKPVQATDDDAPKKAVKPVVSDDEAPVKKKPVAADDDVKAKVTPKKAAPVAVGDDDDDLPKVPSKPAPRVLGDGERPAAEHAASDRTVTATPDMSTSDHVKAVDVKPKQPDDETNDGSGWVIASAAGGGIVLIAAAAVGGYFLVDALTPKTGSIVVTPR